MAGARGKAGLGKLKKEFMAKADEAFGRMFGADGQNGLVTFTQREERACEAGDALMRWLIEKHLEMDPAGEPGVNGGCPICGGPVIYDSAEEAGGQTRSIVTRRGKVEYRRAGVRCPRCRKSFFPPG